MGRYFGGGEGRGIPDEGTSTEKAQTQKEAWQKGEGRAAGAACGEGRGAVHSMSTAERIYVSGGAPSVPAGQGLRGLRLVA